MLSLVLLGFVAMAAGVAVEGPCPEIAPVQNFNVSAYAGKWYEISKYATVDETGGKCAAAEYTLDKDQVVVKNTHVVDGTQYYIEGTARLANEKKTGELIVTFKFGEIARESALWVVATDYKNYAIAFSCNAVDDKTKNVSVWVLSRTQQLEGEAKKAVDDFIKTNSKVIDETKLIKTEFSEEACKFQDSKPVTTKVPVKTP